jgi:hypothetical protein
MLVKYYDQIYEVIDVRTIKVGTKPEEIQFLMRNKHHFTFGEYSSPPYYYNWENSSYCKPANIFESIMWGFKNLFPK